MRIKTTIILLLMLATLTTVSAIDFNNLDLPDNFEKVDEMTYENNITGEKISILSTSSEKLKNFTNKTELKEKINQTQKENIYSFNDETNNMTGIAELIKVDGVYYVVELSISEDASQSKLDENLNILTKFNELNNLTAVNPSTLTY